MKWFIKIIIFFFITTVFFLQTGYTGIISKPFIKGSKYAGKKILKDGVKESSEAIAINSLENISKKYGDDIFNKIRIISSKNKIDEKILLKEIDLYGGVYKNADFAEDAIIFGIKNGEPGRYLLNNFDYIDLKNSPLFDEKSEEVVKQLWRLGDNAIGGSTKKLKKVLIESNISIDECLPCKSILMKKDRYSKIKFNNLSNVKK
jgi:hypothetical protein